MTAYLMLALQKDIECFTPEVNVYPLPADIYLTHENGIRATCSAFFCRFGRFPAWIAKREELIDYGH